MSGFGERSGGFEERLDDETRSLLEELWATPVGRRWLLKAGLGSAVALGVGLGGGAAEAQPQRRSRRRRREATDLHFAFGHLRGVSGLTLVANGERIRLSRHTRASRAELKRRGGLWRAADLSKLSHHVPRVVLPADRAVLLSVHGQRRGREVVVGHVWYVPRATTLALARLAYRLKRSFKPVRGSRRRLAALGLKPSDIRSPRHVAQLATITDTGTTAVGIAMMHPNVATIDPTAAGTTAGLLGQTPAVTDLQKYITRIQLQGHHFGSNVPVDNPDGTPAQIQIGGTKTTFSMFQFNTTDKNLPPLVKAAVRAGVTAVRNNAQLGAVIDQPLEQQPAAASKTWVQSQGLVPQAQPYSGTTQLGAGLDIKVKNPGTVFGTETVVNGAYSGGQVPLKLYNNWVRWVWVYVQYLGANNTNLSANPNATFPDTKYSQNLGLLPQVFTVLGIPLWDTNSIDVTLNFPQGAHTARILFCGLGSDINGGGWRQYFPADAYPDMVAPQDEVLFASLVTGILTIGLNVFALATDLDIATTWASIRKVVAQGATSLEAFDAIVGPVVSRTVALTASETFAASVAAGGATYEDIANNGGSTGNIWSILLGLGSVIPKIIFNPGAEETWLNIAATIGGEEAVDKLESAIPLIGEVIAVIEAVGDLATLAEVAAETIVAPWVIENEVTLTYAATVTVSIDRSQASTFPATAVSWRLEAKVDGAVVLDPITGTVNEGGRIRSDPLVLSVTAPFGGQNIQWSIVFLDAAGQQVGTGVSASYTNNDPANPPSAVAITITQIPVPIGAATVFERADTVGYSGAAGGYTWSNQISDSGTLMDKGIQEVAATAVSTLAGVAAVTWEQNNLFYLRGVPVAQNGATIALGPATGEGFARRPFLLLDPFVGRTDEGNHVLLEPDPTTPDYHVRKVSLDPTTGAPSWDPTVSYGTFTLPISAAALHSSGRVVAVNTDSGRLATLPPAATPRPPQAAYSAGAGSQVGLLSSPVAVAVTNPGVVLVLEAAAMQVSAFDLNGNPVPYFSAAPTARRSRLARRGGVRAAQAQAGYTLALVSAGSYLDLAVDGAGQIYVLYYTGDGSAPADYRVDVYTQTGAVLDTNSPGVNVPHLAVDYWRSIFAANYDPLADTTTGQPHIDPALGVAEPSLSRFDPTNPSSSLARTARRLRRRRARPLRP